MTISAVITELPMSPPRGHPGTVEHALHGAHDALVVRAGAAVRRPPAASTTTVGAWAASSAALRNPRTWLTSTSPTMLDTRRNRAQEQRERGRARTGGQWASPR